MRSSGNDFIVAQGETFDAVFDITDEDGVAYDITGGTTSMTYWQGSGTPVRVAGVISTTSATVTIARATIKAMSGKYKYSFWARNVAGKICRSSTGVIHVETDPDPDAVAP